MPAVESPVQQERERRAAAMREKYHADIEAERERARERKRKQRARFRKALAPAKRRDGYDPADYAVEWEFLTRSWQMKASEIIARSVPSYDWFTAHVLPLVQVSVCGTCGRVFDPRAARSLVRCAKTCGLTRRPGTAR